MITKCSELTDIPNNSRGFLATDPASFTVTIYYGDKRYIVTVVIQIPQEHIVKCSSDDAWTVQTACLLGFAVCCLSLSTHSDMTWKTLKPFSFSKAAILPAPLPWSLCSYACIEWLNRDIPENVSVMIWYRGNFLELFKKELFRALLDVTLCSEGLM